jgi:SAM-dependent methyltransferase
MSPLGGGRAQRDNWDRHWLDYAESTELNPAQRYRRRLIFDLLALEGRQARLLDIGSGQGDFAVDVLRRYPWAELLGLELSEKGVEIARRKAPAARFLQRDLLDPAETAARVLRLGDSCRVLRGPRARRPTPGAAGQCRGLHGSRLPSGRHRSRRPDVGL